MRKTHTYKGIIQFKCCTAARASGWPEALHVAVLEAHMPCDAAGYTESNLDLTTTTQHGSPPNPQNSLRSPATRESIRRSSTMKGMSSTLAIASLYT